MLGGFVLAFLVLCAGLRCVSAVSGTPPVPAPGKMFCRIALRLLRVRVAVRGGPGLPHRLIVANHVSWIDVLVLGSIEAPCFVAKREIAAWPGVAGVARRQGTIFVDRTRRRSLPGVNRAIAHRLDSRSVLLFPEGTTFDGSARGPFRTSLLACFRDRSETVPTREAGLVQSAALTYSDPAAAWVGDATLLPHLWGLLKRPPVLCTLAYGPERAVLPGYDRKTLGRTLAHDVEALLARTSAEQCEAGRSTPREPGGVRADALA